MRELILVPLVLIVLISGCVEKPLEEPTDEISIEKPTESQPEEESASEITSDLEKAFVMLGVGGIIDGRYVEYGKDLKATWQSQKFVLYDNRTFSIDLKCNYLSQDPVDLEYIDSTILIGVQATHEFGLPGEFAHSGLTGVIPIKNYAADSKSCLASYQGSFGPLPKRQVGMWFGDLHSLEIQISWVRIFKDSKGELYYQWMQGNDDMWSGEKLEVNKVHINKSGEFLVYYPLPENKTTEKFNYVEWIKNNVLDE